MKARIKQQDFKTYTEQALKIYELCTLIALNECGWGNKRMQKYRDVLQDVCAEYDRNMCCTDVKGGSKGTNVDCAIEQLIRAADSRNIDWRMLLNADAVGENGLPIKRLQKG